MKSGIKKWSDRLQNVYTDFAEFLHYNQIYNLAARLGYETGQEAWLANPLVEGSVIPEDYRARSHPSAETAVIFRRWRRSGDVIAEELQRIGYRLRPVFRQTVQHLAMREALIAA
jgi:hypothetical protein